jgi:hypothetical protein
MRQAASRLQVCDRTPDRGRTKSGPCGEGVRSRNPRRPKHAWRGESAACAQGLYAYAKEVVRADFEEAGDEDVLRKVRTDFDAANIALTDNQIRGTMDELLATALDQIRNV